MKTRLGFLLLFTQITFATRQAVVPLGTIIDTVEKRLLATTSYDKCLEIVTKAVAQYGITNPKDISNIALVSPRRRPHYFSRRPSWIYIVPKYMGDERAMMEAYVMGKL